MRNPFFHYRNINLLFFTFPLIPQVGLKGKEKLSLFVAKSNEKVFIIGFTKTYKFVQITFLILDIFNLLIINSKWFLFENKFMMQKGELL